MHSEIVIMRQNQLHPRKKILRLMGLSIAASNIGYTLFLFPLLGKLFPKRVPFNMANFLSFIVIDSVAGLLLGTLIYALIRKFKVSMSLASGLSVAVLWLLYWIPYAMGRFDPLIISLDGGAGLITWLSFTALHKIKG